jgi:hypothetical protein
MTVLAGALFLMGKNNKAVKSLAILGASLGILAGGLTAMIVALPGATALLVASGAIVVFSKALKTLGSMDVSSILKGLGAIAGLFVVLGVASAVLAPLVPIIFGLGISVAALGAGMLAAGAGFFAFAAGFALLAATGTAGVAVLTATIVGVAGTIPLIMEQIGLGIIAFAKVISDSGPTLINAFKTLFNSLFQAGIEVAPKFGKMLTVMIKEGLGVIRATSPDWIKTGMQLLLDFLDGLDRNIDQIATKAVSIVVKFIDAIGNQASKITNAAAEMVLKFLVATSATIKARLPVIVEAAIGVGQAIVEGAIQGLINYGSNLITEAANLAGRALQAAKDRLDINSPSGEFMRLFAFVPEGAALGISKNSFMAEKASAEMGDRVIKTMSDVMKRAADAATMEVDTTPVIAPILDLTNVRQNAALIGAMFSDVSIGSGVDFALASDISATQEAAAQAAAEASEEVQPREVKFEQNNYSPKAMSPVEIYRNTKSLLSLAKEGL